MNRIALTAMIALAAFGIHRYVAGLSDGSRQLNESATLLADEDPVPAFACDGRTRCSQMTSCREATWFLQHCAGAKMDGDHDGVPCEEQWCHE